MDLEFGKAFSKQADIYNNIQIKYASKKMTNPENKNQTNTQFPYTFLNQALQISHNPELHKAQFKEHRHLMTAVKEKCIKGIQSLGSKHLPEQKLLVPKDFSPAILSLSSLFIYHSFRSAVEEHL